MLQPQADRMTLTHPRYGAFPTGKAEPPVGVNLPRLLKLAQANYKLEPTKASTLSPIEVVKKVRPLHGHLHVHVHRPLHGPWPIAHGLEPMPPFRP